MDVILPLIFAFVLFGLASLILPWIQHLFHFPARGRAIGQLILAIGLFFFCFSLLSFHYPLVKEWAIAIWILFFLAFGFWFFAIERQRKRQ